MDTILKYILVILSLLFAKVKTALEMVQGLVEGMREVRAQIDTIIRLLSEQKRQGEKLYTEEEVEKRLAEKEGKHKIAIEDKDKEIRSLTIQLETAKKAEVTAAGEIKAAEGVQSAPEKTQESTVNDDNNNNRVENDNDTKKGETDDNQNNGVIDTDDNSDSDNDASIDIEHTDNEVETETDSGNDDEIDTDDDSTNSESESETDASIDIEHTDNEIETETDSGNDGEIDTDDDSTNSESESETDASIDIEHTDNEIETETDGIDTYEIETADETDSEGSTPNIDLSQWRVVYRENGVVVDFENRGKGKRKAEDSADASPNKKSNNSTTPASNL